MGNRTKNKHVLEKEKNIPPPGITRLIRKSILPNEMKGVKGKLRNILYPDFLTLMFRLLWNILPPSQLWNPDAKIKVCTSSGSLSRFCVR